MLKVQEYCTKFIFRGKIMRVLKIIGKVIGVILLCVTVPIVGLGILIYWLHAWCEKKDTEELRQLNKTHGQEAKCPRCGCKVKGKKNFTENSHVTTKTWTTNEKCGEVKTSAGQKVGDIYGDVSHSRDEHETYYTCWFEYSCSSCGHQWRGNRFTQKTSPKSYKESFL